MSIDSGEYGLLMMQNERLPDAALAALMSSGADLAFLHAQGKPLSLELLFPADPSDRLIFPGDPGDAGDGSVPLVTASIEGDPDGDDDGDGIPNKDDPDSDVVVNGTRPRLYDPNAGDDTGGGGGDSGGGGTYEPPAETELDCRDRSALGAQTDIKNESDDKVDEHASVIYNGADGKVHRSPPIEGGTTGVPMAEVLAWMASNGVSMDQVIGLVHNHPTYEYGLTDESVALNRYPSGGAYPGGDWSAAAYMVSRGAGGESGANFAMYVIDPDGKLREFLYTDKEKYESLTKDERIDGDELPDEMVSDGSSCG